MGRRPTSSNRDGFTLVEVLATLAIGSVVIVATAALIRNITLHFDRGVRTVTTTEHLMLAVDRLAADFAAARFVPRATDQGRAAAFSASVGTPATIMFVTSASSGRPGEDLVTLTVEQSEGSARLVRRRAAWPGAQRHFEDMSPADAVVLIEGRVDIAFQFARLAPGGALVWSRGWIGEQTLPRFVRLILRDAASGADLLGETDFIIRADAPAACARGESGVGCLSFVSSTPMPADPAARGKP